MAELLLLDKWFKDGKIPPLDMIECNICGEHAKVSDCKWEMEQESWEMPEYKVYLCPSCNSDDLEYYPSSEYEQKYWEQLYGDKLSKG